MFNICSFGVIYLSHYVQKNETGVSKSAYEYRAFICKGICSTDTYLWNCNCEWSNHVGYCLLLLFLALQPTVGFCLLIDFLPFCSFFTFLSPPSYSHYLQIFFNVCNPSTTSILYLSASSAMMFTLPACRRVRTFQVPNRITIFDVVYCAIRKSVCTNGAKITINLKETRRPAERQPVLSLPR